MSGRQLAMARISHSPFPLLAGALLVSLSLGCGSEIYVIAGQSNAVGLGSVDNTYEAPEELPLPALVFPRGGAEHWRPANDPFHMDEPLAGGSSWPLLAPLLVQTTFSEIRFIAAAVNGSGLVDGPDPSILWTDGLWDELLDRVAVAKADKVEAVLWFQGESDAVQAVPYAFYLEALVELAERADAELGAPLIVAQIPSQITAAWAQPSAVAAIRAAQRDAALLHPNVCAGPETADLGPLSDGIHLTTPEQLSALAERWFDAIAACRGWIQ